MTALFESSLSMSTSMRPLSADVPSMADSLPSINFGFDDLRDRMAKFTARFDTFIEQGRKRVLEERNQFRINVAELQEDQRMKTKDIEILDSKAQSHNQTLAKEAAEKEEIQSDIAELAAQRDAHLQNRQNLNDQIAATQKAIDSRLAAQRAHAQHLSSHEQSNAPEVHFWETALGVSVEGAGKYNHLKFRFSNIHPDDWEKDAWVEFDMSETEYKVAHLRPKLEQEEVDRVMEKLNENRDVVGALKGFRELFIEAVRS